MAYPFIRAHHSRKMSIPMHTRPLALLGHQGHNGATQRLRPVLLALKLDHQQTAGQIVLLRSILLLNRQIRMISERLSVGLRRHHDSQVRGRSSR